MRFRLKRSKEEILEHEELRDKDFKQFLIKIIEENSDVVTSWRNAKFLVKENPWKYSLIYDKFWKKVTLYNKTGLPNFIIQLLKIHFPKTIKYWNWFCGYNKDEYFEIFEWDRYDWIFRRTRTW